MGRASLGCAGALSPAAEPPGPLAAADWQRPYDLAQLPYVVRVFGAHRPR